jgi:EAL domain-containing protein (putative c-di-GMP-specific phosphodiesterase class I)
MNRQVHALREKGFKFALDDYGTGSSNIKRIKHYPFVDVKIDMSVVWDYCKAPDEILPTMISTFKRMGFKTTCEGIEDENMAKIVTELGCDYLQGYLYSKPLPMDEFVKKYSSCNL